MPTELMLTSTARSGCCCNTAVASRYDLSETSSPYTTLTISRPGYFGRALRISASQEFWLVEVGVADTTANFPFPPGESSAASATTVSPISWSEDGARCAMRPWADTAESYETTLMPRSSAFLSVGTSASGSLADT